MVVSILIKKLYFLILLWFYFQSYYIFTFISPSTAILNNNTSLLGLSYLKTRKSGGTNFNTIILSWIMSKCSFNNNNKVSINKYIENGLFNGELHLHEKKDLECPSVSLRSHENRCWDITKIQALPPRGHRHNFPISLFTIIRDPIERIGSQAFFTKDVVGVQTIVKFIIKKCKKYLVQDAYDSYVNCRNIRKTHGHSKDVYKKFKEKCSCFFEAHREAIEELRRNESLWLNWLHPNNNVNSMDIYKKNYYLERMFGGINNKDNNNFTIALNCFRNKECDYKSIGINNIFNELSSLTTCVNKHYSSNDNTTIITKDILELGKKLLKSHIDFVILEKFHDYRSAGAIASLLNTTQREIAEYSVYHHFLQSEFSQDVESYHTTSYRNLMPKSIIKYLEKENEWDIDFYNYALQVFEERAIKEDWKKSEPITIEIITRTNNDD